MMSQLFFFLLSILSILFFLMVLSVSLERIISKFIDRMFK